MKRVLWTFIALMWPALASAQQVIDVTVKAGKHDHKNEPVRVPIDVPTEFANKPVNLTDGADKTIPCQLTHPGLQARKRVPLKGHTPRELHFLLGSLKAGETAHFKLTTYNDVFELIRERVKAVKTGETIPFELTQRTDPPTPEAGFNVYDKAREYSEIRYKDRAILRYMNAPLDESTKENRELTYKVFHHLYDPSGKRLVTKGPGGLYTHHRGLFYGFNKITYGDGKKVDIWHCPVAFQSHEKMLEKEMGPVLGRQRMEIAWHGLDKETFATEQRELTVYNIPGGTLVEFASVLRTTDGPIQLDGDPQHAGFHFRADNEVADKTKAQTIFIRPDGVGEPGKTRNWPDQKNHVNLPWNAMSFVLGLDRYTAAYLDRPSNPKEARFSEREYGRIGSYFAYEVTREKPLAVNYRIWLQEGQMKGDEVETLSRAFVEPVQVTVK
jgi:Methane oxygenase PmoA